METTIEYRVVVDRAGIKSIDSYFNVDRAVERMGKLQKNVKGSVFIQAREVSEWKVIAGDIAGQV